MKNIKLILILFFPDANNSRFRFPKTKINSYRFVFATKIASRYQLLVVHLAVLRRAVSQTTLLSDPLNFPLNTTATDRLTQTNIKSTRYHCYTFSS